MAKINENGNIAVDDTILVKDYETTAGSKMLDGFKPLFTAEAVTRLQNKGYAVSGKTAVSEFGLGLTNGASAELVKNGDVKAALAVDVNGSPRRSAAFSGVDFLKPTYGTVSRYGIVSTAASGEQLGVCAKNAEGIAEIMSVIAGHDDKDGTSLRNDAYDYSVNDDIKGKKVCVIKELANDKVLAFAEKLKANGVIVEEISSDLFETANIAWQILMSAESCNNLSRYDGVKYGHRAEEYRNIDELYVNSRTEGFTFLTKSIILYGSDVLSKNRYKDCYDKSLRVRRTVADTFKELTDKYDAVLTPVMSDEKAEASFETIFKESVYTSIANLVGVPALVSGSVQLTGAHFSESALLSLAHSNEKEGK